jgi:cytochrome c-type biogenesis protein
VFVSFGAVASSIGQLLAAHIAWLSQLAGATIIIFGLHLTGVVRLRWLYATQQLDGLFRTKGPWGALSIGIAFGFGWTPCVGPILATILSLAASEAILGKGAALLSLYSLGLAVPFLAASLAVGRLLAGYQRFRHFLPRVELAAGTLMIAIGVLVFTRHLTVVNVWLSNIAIFRSLAEHFL